MKRFIGYYTEEGPRDTPLESMDFLAEDWTPARKRFEAMKVYGYMLLGLFAVPANTSDAAIERMTAEFHRQFELGTQDSDKLTAALKGGE